MGATDALAALVASARAADVKTRRKLGRSIGNMAMELEKSGAELTLAEMNEVIAALGQGALVHTYPQRYHMSKARLMARRRKALGLADPVVAQETAKTLDIEVGGLVLHDAATPFTEISPDWRAEIAAGRIFAVAFGGDGAVKVRLRVLEAGPCEPMEAEFQRLRAATAEAVLDLPTGALVATGGGAKTIAAQLAPGPWRVTAYGLGLGRNPQCVVFLAPFTGEAPPPTTDVPELPL